MNNGVSPESQRLREIIKPLWLEGLSAGEIRIMASEKLEKVLSRNTIMGHITRMGLARNASEKGKRPVRAIVKLGTLPEPKPDPTYEGPFLLPTGSVVTIFDTDNHIIPTMCRYPIGDPLRPDFHFCGHSPKPGSSYCEFHHAKCWTRANTVAPAPQEIAIARKAHKASGQDRMFGL